MAACVIKGDIDDSEWLRSGSVAIYGALDEIASRHIPAGFCGTVVLPLWTDDQLVNVGYATFSTEIHELVIEAHGPVVWGVSSYLVAAEYHGEPVKSPILWAWNEARELVAIAAAVGEYDDDDGTPRRLL